MKKQILILIPILIFAAGCIPEESPIDPYDRGDITTNTISLGNEYKVQVYYDLNSNSVVKQNPYDIWDLGFDCRPDSFYVILNTANFSKVYITDESDLESINEAPDADSLYRFDSPAGFSDSTAIQKWWKEENGELISKDIVYIIDLGIDSDGFEKGYKKFKLSFDDNGDYIITFADMDGSNKQTQTIEKDQNKNFVNFSFETGEVLKLEPDKTRWDLLFSKHSEMVEYNDPSLGFEPYSVVSALLNTRYVRAAQLKTDKEFSEITLEDTDTLDFSRRRNIIGHDWKYYDFDQGYVVHPDKYYIVQDVEGFYYKLHFIEYYNESGEKGYPEFEFKKL